MGSIGGMGMVGRVGREGRGFVMGVERRGGRLCGFRLH